MHVNTTGSPDSAAIPHAIYAAERSSTDEYISKNGSCCILATMEILVDPGEAITFLIPYCFNKEIII